MSPTTAPTSTTERVRVTPLRRVSFAEAAARTGLAGDGAEMARVAKRRRWPVSGERLELASFSKPIGRHRFGPIELVPTDGSAPTSFD